MNRARHDLGGSLDTGRGRPATHRRGGPPRELVAAWSLVALVLVLMSAAARPSWAQPASSTPPVQTPPVTLPASPATAPPSTMLPEASAGEGGGEPFDLTAEVIALKESLAEARADLRELATRSRENEKIMEELERKAAMQRLSWSAEYRVTLSSFRYQGYALDGARNSDGTPRQVKLKNLEQWTHRARLAMQADVGKTLRFRARMAVYKRFGESNEISVSDGTSGRVPREAVLRLDRFWIDWFITERLGLSIGRISATDGSPAELRENLERPASTFAVGNIDREYDVAIATYKVGQLLLRGFYASWQFQKEGEAYNALPFAGLYSDPVRIYGFGVQYRSNQPRIPSVDVSTYHFPRFRVFPPYGLASAGGALPSKLPSDLGSMDGVSALVLSRDLLPGVDAFLSLSVTDLDPSGQAVEYPIGPGGASVPVLVLSSTGADTHYGYQLYGGVRATSPWGGKRAPKVGFEMTYGSRYLVNFSTPTSDLVSRLGVRGRTYDVYAIQPIHPNLFARLSWTLVDYDYAPPVGGVAGPVMALGGTAPETKRKIMGVNLALNASF